MVLEVRPARAGDGPGCAAAWLEAAREYATLDPARFAVPDTEGLAAFFEQRCTAPTGPDQIRLVAERDGRFAGFLTAHLRRPAPEDRYQLLRHARYTTLQVDALLVAGRARRGGVATALMAAAHRWAAAAGARLATLDTYAAAPASVPFYQRRMGYTPRAIVLDRPLTDGPASSVMPPGPSRT